MHGFFFSCGAAAGEGEVKLLDMATVDTERRLRLFKFAQEHGRVEWKLIKHLTLEKILEHGCRRLELLSLKVRDRSLDAAL